jgi:hypothetical protein
MDAENSPGSNITLNSIDITTGNIITSGGVFTRGTFTGKSTTQTIKTGDISAQNIELITDRSLPNTSITTGHLASSVIMQDYGVIPGMYGVVWASNISLSAAKIEAASIFAKSIAQDPSTGRIDIDATDSFSVTGTIPETADLGRVRTDISSGSTTATPISIAGGQITITQPGTQWIEGTNLEHDANDHVVYRLASNPETLVDIVAINPQDGSLVLKEQATGKIIVGDRVVIRSANIANPSNVSATKGLIVALNPNQESLAELTGKLKQRFNRDTATYQVEEYRYTYYDPARISVRNPGFGPDTIDGPIGTVTFLPPPDLKSANQIGGSLPGSYDYSPQIITAPLPLPADIQAAIDQYNQRTTTIATPNPTLTPAPAPTPEAPAAPKFDQSSILNATIDPTDTINLSAGAIRGATINPGGLLKVELDTRNPEGVLTRKVTTK